MINEQAKIIVGEDELIKRLQELREYVERKCRFIACSYSIVPDEINREKHEHVLVIWNECMANYETLETVWPKLVKAMQETK